VTRLTSQTRPCSCAAKRRPTSPAPSCTPMAASSPADVAEHPAVLVMPHVGVTDVRPGERGDAKLVPAFVGLRVCRWVVDYLEADSTGVVERDGIVARGVWVLRWRVSDVVSGFSEQPEYGVDVSPRVGLEGQVIYARAVPLMSHSGRWLFGRANFDSQKGSVAIRERPAAPVWVWERMTIKPKVREQQPVEGD